MELAWVKANEEAKITAKVDLEIEKLKLDVDWRMPFRKGRLKSSEGFKAEDIHRSGETLPECRIHVTPTDIDIDVKATSVLDAGAAKLPNW